MVRYKQELVIFVSNIFMMNTKIAIAKSDKEISACFEAMHELRPHLKKEKFVATINKMKKEGYILAYLKENKKVVAATGYRYINNLFSGKLIYVDDLSTMQQYRKRGYAKMLMDFIRGEAEKNKCNHIDLDSGCGPHRYDAHRFYLRYGFNITSHHFALVLG